MEEFKEWKGYLSDFLVPNLPDDFMEKLNESIRLKTKKRELKEQQTRDKEKAENDKLIQEREMRDFDPNTKNYNKNEFT